MSNLTKNAAYTGLVTGALLVPFTPVFANTAITEAGAAVVTALAVVATSVAVVGGAMVTTIAAGIAFRWFTAFLAK